MFVSSELESGKGRLKTVLPLIIIRFILKSLSGNDATACFVLIKDFPVLLMLWSSVEREG